MRTPEGSSAVMDSPPTDTSSSLPSDDNDDDDHDNDDDDHDDDDDDLNEDDFDDVFVCFSFSCVFVCWNPESRHKLV